MTYANGLRAALLASSAAIVAYANPALAQSRSFDVPAQSASSGITTFAEQADIQILVVEADTRGRQTRAVRGTMTAAAGLKELLAGSGLSVIADNGRTVTLSAGPQSASAGGDVEALIVTAQKREENIQDVPIAISAFSQEDLTTRQVAGGPDLMTQVPNMTFTKTNFSSYSIQLRGIGTQAVSATTDAAVAVAFNNTPFIRNRFFEQEFYDLQRIEVLRGPQGTLYGRNATAGVVNIISAKPAFRYEARLSGDAANYNSTRFEGMVNIPLVEDVVALRLAGAWTKRDGYADNQITDRPIDGRDLWSTRLSLRFAPTDRIDANLIWEHFEEDDDRLRSGKQLCNTHEVTDVGGISTTHYQVLPEGGQTALHAGVQASFSQGCRPTSLYAPESFETPNGLSLPYYVPLAAINLPTALDDPYVSRTQSPDLRTIESTVDPQYRAKSDVAELQVSFDLTDNLTLTSETAYGADFVFSLQDFNRFNTAPGAWDNQVASNVPRQGILTPGPNGGIFCDPQIGCSDRLVAVDLSTAKSRSFSQEFRLSSDFEGPFNFSLGANFMRYDTEDKYYVFINSISMMSALSLTKTIGLSPYVGGVTDNYECLLNGAQPGDPNRVYSVTECNYIDPNPIGSLNDKGHNYFLSKNPYKLISYAAFGEAYYQLTDNLKITGGLRWTVDKKEAPRIPSWVLASQSVGYPVAEVIEQEWGEPTGRLAIDWKPDLSFTDETLLYASYARGYKAGGANPPKFTYVYYTAGAVAEAATASSATRPKTFDAEYVNSFEVGAKNTFMDGRVTLNLAAFYYDYTGYQISEIVDRSAFNHNYDADIWGLEIEADWRPMENLRLGFKGGYENTRLADGSQAVDLMDRTAGHDDWIVNRPFPTFASNCILPVWLFTYGGTLKNVGAKGGGSVGGCEIAYFQGYDPITNLPFDENGPPTVGAPGGTLGLNPGYPGWDPSTAPNNGEGFYKDLSGNELPNAPNFTSTLTADYTIPLPGDWLATLHGDFYYQSESWWRIFNTEGFDKLKAYTNVNLAAIFTNEDAGWKVMAYVKNVFDRDSITGAFLNSDDTGLTTNVFLTEPRLYGIRVTKDWTGGSLLGGFGARHEPGQPYLFTVELGGQAQRHDAPSETYRPAFLDNFGPGLDLSGDQNADLDWGDGRDIKLTYAPQGGWKASLGARFGETNHSGSRVQKGQTFRGCNFLAPCVTTQTGTEVTNYGAADTYASAEHTIVDLIAGHDIDVGNAFDSTLLVGLRFANLASSANTVLYGTPDWFLPATRLIFDNATHHEYRGVLQADREFEGTGPVAAWDVSYPFLGNEEYGHIDVDVSLSGGVLFGRQQTSLAGGEIASYYVGRALQTPHVLSGSPVVTPIDIHRSKSVTVPTFGASLGLSYKIDRMNIGAGYRWERYFDAIDGGIAEHRSYDRTIDGPYLNVSIGFGG